MIWGSQWDAMLNFALTNPLDSSKVSANTNGNYSFILKTGIWLGPDNQTDKINNIIDLEGNVKEWTMEAFVDNDYNRRTLRKSNYRSWDFPSMGEDTYIMAPYATRVSLYIN